MILFSLVTPIHMLKLCKINVCSKFVSSLVSESLMSVLPFISSLMKVMP